MTRRGQSTAPWIPLILLLLFGNVVWALAYQVSFRAHLAVGGDSLTHRREDDAPFLWGFHASEPAQPRFVTWWELPPGYSYRWSREVAGVVLPGIGGGQWVVRTMAQSGRADGSATMATWWLDEQTHVPLELGGEARVYHLLVRASAAGDVAMTFESPSYTIETDPRPLGFVLRDITLAPAGTGLRPPAWAQLAWLTLSLLLLTLVLQMLVGGWRTYVTIGGGIIIVAAALLITTRLALTLATPLLTWLLLICAAIALVVHWVASSVERTRMSPGRRLVVALMLLAWVLRVGGVLHPHAIASDHRLHANNVLEVGLGTIYFTEGLPDRAGGGQSPYPPGVYLVLAPLQLLLPNADMDSRVLVVQAGVALLDSLVIGMLWLTLIHIGVAWRGALMGAALYVLPIPIMPSFSIGEYANIGGQVLALPSLLTLMIGWAGHLGWAALVSIGLLGHAGVTISLVSVLAVYWFLVAGMTLWQRQGYATLVRLTMLLIVAATSAWLIFYSAPLFWSIYTERLGNQSATDIIHAPSPPFLDHLGHIIYDIVRGDGRLSPLLIVCGLAGMILLWQAHTPSHITRQHGGMVLGAWWGGVLLSLGLLLIANQGVRWQLFLYPALCLAAGPTLGWWWRYGRTGRLVVGVLIALLWTQGLLGWVQQIADYLH